MGDDLSNALAEAMNRLWAKHLPQMLERVATLKNAAESLNDGTLTRDAQHLAAADAHKLAGVLGTFGLTQGTELAREAEGLYETILDGNLAAAQRLIAIADRLQTLVANQT